MLWLAIFLYFQLSPCGIAPWSCGDYATTQDVQTYKISVGAGPEDMAFDTSSGAARIIVSCSDRRDEDAATGSFYQINPTDHSTSRLRIKPSNLAIFPHGIDVETIEGIPYLYAISHHGKGIETEHKIFRFIIKQDTLIQDESYVLEDSLMTGPNDIDVLSDGSFYVSNPMPSNQPTESTKAILGIKNGNVLHFDGNGNWNIAVKEMCYPNGVYVDQEGSHLFVANGGCQAVERFKVLNGKVVEDEKLSTVESDVDIPIGDNLLLDNHGVLWTAAHPCPLKFLKHVKRSEDKSPIQIFNIDPKTMAPKLIFQNNGELISAASTVLRIENQLFVSQVFDPFVLVVEGLDF